MPDYLNSSNLSSNPVPEMNPNPELATPVPTLNTTPSTEFSKFKLKPKTTGLRMLLPVLMMVIVVVAVAAGLVLVRSSQDVRQQASTGPDYTCGSGVGLFSSLVPNSTPCLWEGAPYYKCSSGYHNESNGCVKDSTSGTPSPSSSPSPSPSPSSNTTLASCGTDFGLFGSEVGNSHACTWNGVTQYACNSGYHNAGGGCAANSTATTCQSGAGLIASNVANSNSCIFEGVTWYQCNNGFHTEGSQCAPNVTTMNCWTIASGCDISVEKTNCGAGEYTSEQSCRATLAQTYKVDGERCVACLPASSCGFTLAQCNAELVRQATTVTCWGLHNDCALGVDKQACSSFEYDSWGACNTAYQAILVQQNQPTCWATTNGCLMGLSRPSCLSGEYTSSDACYAAISTTSSDGTGSLAGSSVTGE